MHLAKKYSPQNKIWDYLQLKADLNEDEDTEVTEHDSNE